MIEDEKVEEGTVEEEEVVEESAPAGEAA